VPLKTGCARYTSAKHRLLIVHLVVPKAVDLLGCFRCSKKKVQERVGSKEGTRVCKSSVPARAVSRSFESKPNGPTKERRKMGGNNRAKTSVSSSCYDRDMTAMPNNDASGLISVFVPHISLLFHHVVIAAFSNQFYGCRFTQSTSNCLYPSLQSCSIPTNPTSTNIARAATAKEQG
jgi:hypothetical protein